MLIQPIAEENPVAKICTIYLFTFLHKYSHIHIANFSKLFIGYIYVY